MDYSSTANLFNPGATSNVGSGAWNMAVPMMTASNNYSNAMNQLAMARLNSRQNLSNAGLNMENLRTQNYLQSLQPGPLDYIGLGLAGYGAVRGLQAKDTVNNFGYYPNFNLPVPPVEG